jgi:methylenetetrahydrofolate/methylenetetrahydromethanopterin dehydrogenase (NADP+)
MAEGKASVLIQLDPDPHPSVFDSMVAIDAGVDRLLPHGGVKPEQVRDLVYGALFTRGPADLARTAIFVGGSDVAAGEALFRAVTQTFFGPFRVSVLFDANGANTTATAAVLAAIEGMGGAIQGVPVAVVAATGPVGQRVARLLAGLGAEVAISSRRIDRAETAAAAIQKATGHSVQPFAAQDEATLRKMLADRAVVVTAGAVGACLLPRAVWQASKTLKVAIDLNAVPPLGIEGLEATDRGALRDGVKAWGALGIGATKMKIHKKAIAALFTSNDKVLDAEQVLQLAQAMA